MRYAAGARFPHHQHPGGEEILVLSGTFSDEDGHYPAGWYLRNPPGSGHRPFSDDGAVIFVTLRADEQSYDRGSWVRLPAGEYPEFVAGAGGVTLYLKTGHLSATTGTV